MIDDNNEIQKKNIELLIAGYWYMDLPPVMESLMIIRLST